MSQAGPGQAAPKSFETIGGTDGTPARALKVNSSGELSITSTTGTTTAANTADAPLAGDGRKTVTTAGTAVALAASTVCRWVVVSALTSNTQQINVGASTVLAAAGTSRGIPLAAGQSAV